MFFSLFISLPILVGEIELEKNGKGSLVPHSLTGDKS